MSKRWSDFSLGDWIRLRPLAQAMAARKRRAVEAAYRVRPAAFGDVVAIGERLAGRDALVTLAFADPNATRWQAALVRHFVPGAVHVVVDASPIEPTANRVRRVCAAEGVPYLQLPSLPTRGRAARRACGLAIDWTWHNLLRPAGPHAFGFVADDVFPTGPDDPFAPLATQPFHGAVRTTGDRPGLRAEFCFFRTDAVADFDLDFVEAGGEETCAAASLETLVAACGGGAAPTLIEPRSEPFRSDVTLADGAIHWYGAWLHEAHRTGRPELTDEKRRAVGALIAPHLAAAMRPFVASEPATLP
jgi:hypothetical protein